MHMTSTECITEVDQSWINENIFFWSIQKILEVFEVSEAATNAIPAAVLVQDKDLARGEPTLFIIRRINHEKTSEMEWWLGERWWRLLCRVLSIKYGKFPVLSHHLFSLWFVYSRRFENEMNIIQIVGNGQGVLEWQKLPYLYYVIYLLDSFILYQDLAKMREKCKKADFKIYNK